MRYDADAALHEIVVRGAHIRSKEQHRRTYVLSAAVSCLAVAIMLTYAALLPAIPADMSPSAFGAFLLPSQAGGYVLAGVIAFTCGAGFTLACLKYRSRINGEEGRAGGGAPVGDEEEE